MKLTYNDLLNLECCVQSAIYDLNGKIAELKGGKMTDNSVKALDEALKNKEQEIKQV